MLKSLLNLLVVGMLFCDSCHAVPDLPLLTYDKINGRYVPISEGQWAIRIEKNFIFPKLKEEELFQLIKRRLKLFLQYIEKNVNTITNAEINDKRSKVLNDVAQKEGISLKLLYQWISIPL